MKNNKNLTLISVRKILNRSAHNLDRKTAESLHNARNKALARHRALQHAPVQAWLTHHGILTGSSSHSYPRPVYWVLAVLFALSLYSSINYLQHDRDHTDVDIELLTDDLPVDAYVD